MADHSSNPHLYGLIAGEISGDTLGAGLMKAILRHDPQAQFIGIGGPKMTALGLKSPFKMEELSVMGIFEVISHLLPILRIRKEITALLIKARPAVFIGIDSPDFNLAVERKLKEAGITTVHYVSPSVWAWREGRMEKIKRSCDEVLALLPFEKDFYDRHQMPCTYVGHTLAAQIDLEVDQKAARTRCGLARNCVEKINGKVLAILPGSRKGIISRMLPLYAKTARLLRAKLPNLTFVSVAPNHDIALLIKDIWLEHAPEISLTVFVGKTQDVIAAADVSLLTCGTIAFETMLLKCPMVVAYKVSRFSAAIARRMLKVKMYSLPNLLAQREIVKELIQEDCTPINMCAECIRLLTSNNILMRKEFTNIHRRIRTNTDELAAQAVLRLAHGDPKQVQDAAQSQNSYQNFLTRSSSANIAHKDEAQLTQISTAVLDVAKGEVPGAKKAQAKRAPRSRATTSTRGSGTTRKPKDSSAATSISEVAATEVKKPRRSPRRKATTQATANE